MKAFALFVVALLAAAFLVVPSPNEPVPEAPVPLASPPFAVCSLGEAARRTSSVSVLGGGAGTLEATVFSAGEVVASEEVAMSEGGFGSLSLDDVTGLARAPVTLTLDDPSRKAGMTLAGAGVAAAACDAGSQDPVVLAGASTSEGETFTVILANPFAGTARADLVAASEIGTESDPALEGLVVPPHSLIGVEMGSLLPGRQVMSVAVDTTAGRVIAGGVHEGAGEAAAMQGITADVDWYLPVPDFPDLAKSIVLFAPGTAEVPFQLDVYGPEGLFEAALEGTVPARGQTVIPVADLLEGPGTVRVVAAGPVAAVLTLGGEAVRAMIPGVPAPGPTWLLPGAGDLGATRVHVFNPGEIDINASLVDPTGDPLAGEEVPAGRMVTLALPEGGAARVEADGDVVVTWATATDGGVAGDAGRSLDQ
ncbi:MAG TPA: DUF5719 family protein [Acidimicrobiia bacterium]|nr:DUF5719 family protein [Acidimicrobiia bacterium]